MCLTHTVDCIDFDNLTEEQKCNLQKVKARLEERKVTLEMRLDELRRTNTDPAFQKTLERIIGSLTKGLPKLDGGLGKSK